MKNWTKTPKHILRFNALQFMVKNLPKGNFLEFGAGTGDFTKYFLNQGFNGTAYDIDDRTIEVLRKNLQDYTNIQIIRSLKKEKSSTYDYIFAFEVLEHIENDLETLNTWKKYLKKDGIVVISVPAHQRKFSKEDKRVGHIRRYEKEQLYRLAKDAGFSKIKIINYGFPLGNITRSIKNILNRTKKTCKPDESVMENTIKSGIERDSFENQFKFFFHPFFLMPFVIIQKLFFNNDLSDGYILTAKSNN